MQDRVNERFWSKVRKSDGCWEWTGARVKGYGRFRLHGRSRQAHAVAYELAHGPIPEGRMVCHHCDNRRCVRPEHLYAGTHQDNMDDVVARHRSPPGQGAPPGERNGAARLTAARVREMRARRSAGESYASLSVSFGVSVGCVFKVTRRETWRHVA